MKKTILYSLICTAAIAAGCAVLTKLTGSDLSGFCYCMIMAGLAACVIGVGFTPSNRGMEYDTDIAANCLISFPNNRYHLQIF